jgi:hypothetical protein
LSMDGGAVIVALAVFALAALSLRTAIKSYSSSVLDFHQLIQWYIPLGDQWWWVPHVHVPWQHQRHNVVVWCFRIPTSAIPSRLTKASEILR